LTGSTPHWLTANLAHWDGDSARRVQITANVAAWNHSGQPVVPRRWVLMRASAGRCEPQAWLAAGQTPTPVQLLTSVVRRWQIEVTFEEAEAHLGSDDERRWREQATARATPAGLALSSMVPRWRLT
jgi:hypothetical protein